MTRTDQHTDGQLLVARTRLKLDVLQAVQAGQNGSQDTALAREAYKAGLAQSELDRINKDLESGAWARLVALFGLDAGEAALLSVAVALRLEPDLGQIVSQLQGAHALSAAPTEALVRRLFVLPDRPLLRSNSRLRFWHLIQDVRGPSGDPPGYAADPVIADWMTGHLAIDADLAYFVRHHRADFSLPSWPVQHLSQRIQAVLDTGQPVAVLTEGQAGSARTDFAALVAAELGYGAVAHGPLDNDLNLRVRLERFALFSQAALIGPVPDIWPDGLPPAPLHFIPTQKPRDHAGVHAALTMRAHLPTPAPSELRAVWAQSGGNKEAWAESLEFARLRDVRDVARLSPRTATETARAFARLCRARMGHVGQPVEPVYQWDDLIVSDTLRAGLQGFAREARDRGKVLEPAEVQRIFRAAAGLSVMFCGPPGVGKSMSAQIIARDLGVPLLCIDLGAVSSKYVGETAKNLTAAFREARNAAAVLFFDEADALFAKRTEAADATGRYANADTGHLLQLLEGHEGVVILSTNRRGAIDPAFVRRLRHVFEFQRAEAAQRADIWRQLLGAMQADVAGLSAPIAALSQSADISPSQIKSAVLTARYASLTQSSPIDGAMLEAAVALEYAKEGRTSERTTLRRAKR